MYIKKVYTPPLKMRKWKNFIAMWGLKMFKLLNAKICFNFRTRGVWFFVWRGLPDQLLPGYCMYYLPVQKCCENSMEIGGLCKNYILSKIFTCRLRIEWILKHIHLDLWDWFRSTFFCCKKGRHLVLTQLFKNCCIV